MILVVACAVAFAVVHEDPESLDHVAFTLYLALTCPARLGAKFRRGNRPMKMFWKGFAVFGWAYLFAGLAVGQTESKVLFVHSALGLAFAVRRAAISDCDW